MIHKLTPEEVRALIEPPKRVDRRCTIPGRERLTEDQDWILGHWSMFGSDGYPVRKIGRKWQVVGQRGHGAFPTVFNTKREAVAAWEGYIGILCDYLAGRIENPALRGLK